MQRAWAAVEADELAELDLALTSIPSPTGEERQVAEFLVQHLRTGRPGRHLPGHRRRSRAMPSAACAAAALARTCCCMHRPIRPSAATWTEELPWLGASIRADLAPQGLPRWRLRGRPGRRKPQGVCHLRRRGGARRPPRGCAAQRLTAGRTGRGRHAHEPSAGPCAAPTPGRATAARSCSNRACAATSPSWPNRAMPSPGKKSA